MRDALQRRALLRDRPPPGARLVRVLSAVQPPPRPTAAAASSSASAAATMAGAGGAGSAAAAQAEVRLALLTAAVGVGDVEGAHRLCKALLATPQVVRLPTAFRTTGVA